MSHRFPDDDEDLVDLSCYEHLKLAVEALLLTPELSHGLQSAFLQLMMLQEADFAGEARDLFGAIMAKHDEVTKDARQKQSQEAQETINQFQKLVHISSKSESAEYQPVSLSGAVPEDHHFYRHQYHLIYPRTKFWFKQRIWRLFTSVRCDDR